MGLILNKGGCFGTTVGHGLTFQGVSALIWLCLTRSVLVGIDG